MARLPLRLCRRPGRSPAVLDVGDGDAKPLDLANHLAVEISVAIHMGRRNEELRLVPFRLEVPTQLRKRDGLLERPTFAAHRDRIDPRWQARIDWLQ